jgi:CRP-like cAMP-binding protein
MDAVEFLKKTTLFCGLSDEQIASVLETAKIRPYAEGETIIEEGATGRGFYLILEGSAQVRKGGKVLADFGPGDYVGEMSALHVDAPREADVIATSEVSCLVISSWDLRAIMASHPEIAMRMIGELLRRLRATNASISG